MPAVFVWLFKIIGPTRFVGGVIAVVMALVLFLGVVTIGLAAMTKGDAVNQMDCTGVAWDTPYQLEGVDYIERYGQAFNKMSDGKDDPADIALFMRSIGDTLSLWRDAFLGSAFNDTRANEAVTGYRLADAEARAKALAACCVTQPPPVQQDPATPPPPPVQEPFDPKTAALQNPASGKGAVWAALQAAGFDDVHAAGVMGNMQAESGFDPLIVQGGGHSTRPADAGNLGYGLVQWTPGRKLSDYIGTATPTITNQVATLKAQLAGQGPHPEKRAGDAFWATRDVTSAARVFHLDYERSASKDSTARIANAKRILAEFGGTGTVDVPEIAPACTPAVAAEPNLPGSEAALAMGEVLASNPAGKTTMDGKIVSRVVAAQIQLAERQSGIQMRVMQGGFGGSGIAASKTSHNYSGVVDISPGTIETETALRKAGFAAWSRNVPGRSLVGSGAHVHAVSMLDPETSNHPQLVGSWKRNENGLDGRPDPAPKPPWYTELLTLTKVGEPA